MENEHEELVCDFGVLPDYVGLGDNRPTPEQLEVGVRFRLELWRVEENYQLRHASDMRDFAADSMRKLHLSFVREGRFPGSSSLNLEREARYQRALLSGRYDDLEWMRATAQKLSQIFAVPLEETDGGYNDY